MSKEVYTEKDASDIIREVVECLAYCHSLGLAHGNLKVKIQMDIFSKVE